MAPVTTEQLEDRVVEEMDGCGTLAAIAVRLAARSDRVMR